MPSATLPEIATFLHYAKKDYPVRLVACYTTGPHPQKRYACKERTEWLDRTLARHLKQKEIPNRELRFPRNDPS